MVRGEVVGEGVGGGRRIKEDLENGLARSCRMGDIAIARWCWEEGW